MKKVIILSLSVVMTFGFMSFVNNTNRNPTEVVLGSSFKLINNTGESVKLKHKGGSMTLNNGASTSLSCNVGNDIYIDGEKIHTIESSDCGKSIKLSTWM